MNNSNQNTNKFMRGAVKYTAEKLGVPLQRASYRIKRFDPLAIQFAAEYETLQKNKIKEAVIIAQTAHDYNPLTNIIDNKNNN